jgi:hypothetical protein
LGSPAGGKLGTLCPIRKTNPLPPKATRSTMRPSELDLADILPSHWLPMPMTS